MTRIFLTGYMGSGKTTLGRALAAEMGIPFIDLDHYIEKRYCKTIAQLFAEKGEDGFRCHTQTGYKTVNVFFILIGIAQQICIYCHTFHYFVG